MHLRTWFHLLIIAGTLSACNLAQPTKIASTSSVDNSAIFITPSHSPSLPATPLPTASPEPSPTSPPEFTLWVSPAVPDLLRGKIATHSQIRPVEQADENSLRIEPANQQTTDSKPVEVRQWVYALVAPFPTVFDEVSLADFQNTWKGSPQGNFENCRLAMSPATVQAFSSRYGQPAENAVQQIPGDQLLDQAWQSRTLCAVIPFEELQPKWKVLRIDGVSPYDRNFQAESYPLTINFQLDASTTGEAFYRNLFPKQEQAYLPATNRDSSKLSVVVMTGVTAMVRATAWKMDTLGVLFPAETIGDVLRDADITHISNEVSFAPDCPLGDPNTASLRFCSRPEYIQLLESVSTDVVELTGNHMEDWGPENMLYTLQLYKDHGLKYYAGGANLDEARKALLIEDHGNKFAFIGCNPAGPPHDWATDSYPGSAPCDLDWEAAEIGRLRSEGYLPIATFQYMEAYDSVPVPYEQRDFRKVAEAGAVIVSGSQAHYPAAFEFSDYGLIHYGPGNLFFDQMNPIINGLHISGTRKEFIDRHIFYDGKYLGTDLVTAMLEDYARPRPMTPDERSGFLQDIFAASGW